MTAAIANADVLARVMALSDDARICTAMRMYEHCTSLTRALVAELSAQKPELAPSQWMALVAAYDRTAKAAVERECIPPKRSAEEDAILGMVLPAYDRIIRATGL